MWGILTIVGIILVFKFINYCTFEDERDTDTRDMH